MISPAHFFEILAAAGGALGLVVRTSTGAEDGWIVEKAEGSADRSWDLGARGRVRLECRDGRTSDGVKQWPFRLVVDAKEAWTGAVELHLLLPTTEEPFFLVPGAVYGSNNAGQTQGIHPQLCWRGEAGYPQTPELAMRMDRSTHNLVALLAEGCWWGLHLEESSAGSVCAERAHNGFYLDARGDGGFAGLGVTMGYRHFPVLYRGKLGDASTSAGPVEGWVAFAPGESWTAGGHFQVLPQAARTGAGALLRSLYPQIHDKPVARCPRDEAIEALAGAIVENGYNAAHHYFPTVVSGSLADTGRAGDVSWTGGMQVAYPLLRAAPYCARAAEVALDFIENLIAHGVNPSSGLFYESQDGPDWRIGGWWTDRLQVPDPATGRRLAAVHSAYVNGQACCYLLKSAAHADRLKLGAGIAHWRATVRGVLDRVLPQQRSDGALPTFLHPATGKAVSYDGFQGAWWFAAAAELFGQTRDPALGAGVAKAGRYYRTWMEQWTPWGTPLDTHGAVDEEGNLALITGLCALHRATGESEWLEGLQTAFDFECSWKFPYATRFANEPLNSLGWSSTGGSVTSVHNIHLHPMGNLVAEELYYTVQQTGDAYLECRLRDTLVWGLGIFNRFDGEFGFGLRGWATEQFFHSDGVQDDPRRVCDGGIWPDFLPWAASCALLSCCSEIPDRFFSSDG